MIFLFLLINICWIGGISGLTEYGPGCSVNETAVADKWKFYNETLCNDLPRRYLGDLDYERKCECKKGYYRDFDLYDCVLPDDCSCRGDNEVRGCSQCEPTCQEPNKTCPLITTCTQKQCVCAPGFVRNMGMCLPESTCLRCGPRERYVRRGGCEEKSCQEPNRKDTCPEVGEPASSDLSIYPQCICLPGYVRSSNKPIEIGHYSIGTDAECIELKDCPNSKQKIAGNTMEKPENINGSATTTSPIPTTCNGTSTP